MIIIALGDHRVNRIFDELRQGIREIETIKGGSGADEV
jgi:hypothetical protein